MNKEYTYIDGQVIISDENGKKTPVDYYDNLDEILIQENLIETIENKISLLEKESNAYKKYNAKHYIPFFLLMGLMTIVGVPVLFSHCVENPTGYISTSIGEVNQNLFIFTAFSAITLPFTGFMELDRYTKYKDCLKREKGINSELEFLKQQIIVEKERLVELKSKKTRTNENQDFRVVKVNDLEILKIFKSWLNLYYDLGYNGEKYYKYYQQGKLDAKLGKHYTDFGIEIAKEYLEEKGPTLIKRRKNK